MIASGMHCLVYHEEHAWVPGIVNEFNGKVGVVTILEPKCLRLSNVKETDMYICDEKTMDEDVDDLLQLSVLHEGTLLNVLRRRYMREVVYTNIGAIVVALNPFNFKIPWYMDSKMSDYLAEGDTILNNIPHSWAVTHNTYYEMLSGGENQCILISGESGAGKTEAAKIVMSYLSAISSLNGGKDNKSGSLVRSRMMESNPILEAFGNAKTVRNNNSSRFGKLMKIKFDENGNLIGADITKYLLEKSRIITSAENERVYHSFYFLLRGKDRNKFNLDNVEAYRSVNQGQCTTVNGMDDAEEYDTLCHAMMTCGINDASQESVWRVVSAILTLQRVDYLSGDSDNCIFDPNSAGFVETSAAFFNVDVEMLKKELLTTTLNVNNNQYQMSLNMTKALDARDSLCKSIYAKLFGWLVTAINKTIAVDDASSWIALLDIFGFEDFKTNSFEQLCINLTNETLQGHYNNFIFVRDMDECRLEGVDTTDVKFPDNGPCLEMISGKMGILAILDEECLLGKSTDLSFLQKLCDNLPKNPFFECPKLAKIPSFKIKHYAGTVTYDVNNFLEKNRDTLKNSFKLIFRQSHDPLVAELLPEPVPNEVRYTVGGFFKNQLSGLMDLINTTNPHWIRCIKPHKAMKPLHFDGILTLTQLKSSGVLGTVEIRKAGYPVRIKLHDFVQRYKIIVKCLDSVDNNDTSITNAIFQSVGFNRKMAQVGKTRAFLKSEAYQQLEILKKQALEVYAKVVVMAAQISYARHRTSAFQKNSNIEMIQAFLSNLHSQHLFREKDFAIRKDTIISQVKMMLVFQKQEGNIRKDILNKYSDAHEDIKREMETSLRILEANWVKNKSYNDERDIRVINDEEDTVRVDVIKQCQDCLIDIMSMCERDYNNVIVELQQKEEEKRQIELQIIQAENERLRREEMARIEKELAEANARKERIRTISCYYWNKNAEETAKAKRHADQQKVKQRYEARSSGLTMDLLRNERALQIREKRVYPSPRFRYDSKGHIVDVGSTELMKIPSKSPSGSGIQENSIKGMSSTTDALSRSRTPCRSIDEMNPKFSTTAEVKMRIHDRLKPDRNDSLQMIQKFRRLQRVRDPIILRTPQFKIDDVRNPMNPNNPSWNLPENGTIVLLDGTHMYITDDMELPTNNMKVIPCKTLRSSTNPIVNCL